MSRIWRSLVWAIPVGTNPPFMCRRLVITCGVLNRGNHSIGINSGVPRYPGSICYHAEVDALEKYRRKLNLGRAKRRKAIVVVSIRVKKTGELASGKPCQNCVKYMLNYPVHISHVYYSDENGEIRKESLTSLSYTEYLTKSSRKNYWRRNK